jgi:hypothetical protein
MGEMQPNRQAIKSYYILEGGGEERDSHVVDFIN